MPQEPFALVLVKPLIDHGLLNFYYIPRILYWKHFSYIWRITETEMNASRTLSITVIAIIT